MSKNKNKNKNRNNVQNNHTQQVMVNASRPVLSDENKLEIEIKNEELQGIEPAEELMPESEAKLKDAESRLDLAKYWNYVKDINKRLESLISKTEDEKNRTSKMKEELESAKKEVEITKIDLTKKIEESNRKDKELTEREFALDNNEYTGVIRRLLETLKEAEKKVFTDTESIIKELSAFHKNNLNQFSDYYKNNAEYNKEFSEFKRMKKKFEVDKQIFEEDLRDEYETKYSEQLILKTVELERLQKRMVKMEEENSGLKQLYHDLQNAFDSADPKEVLTQYASLKTELTQLKIELNERPENYELDTKQAKIEELQAKVVEYQSKINEGELLELKRILSNMDSYVIEINAYKNQIESAKVREVSLKKTIDDLSLTIDQLKGESNQKADAFEYSKKCDSNNQDLGYNHLENKKDTPSSLSELISYVQQWMAYKSDKPFYYSQEIIRIFLAGLHMSPITILQGISGTGKTSLPREFAKALISDGYYVGIDAENQNKAPYRICAVQSGWRDNMDLMGYYNSFEHKYKETDFFKALYIANQPKYKDTLFFIILDEMNLSRPEHYFADFLSLLEQSPNERFINLSNTPEEVLPKLIKGGKLKIPENVRFVGTANHDETTLEFAPKTYDRSNLMEMPRNHPGRSNIIKQENLFNIKYSWLSELFESAEQKHTDCYKRFESFINSYEMKILLMDKGIGIGNRLEYQAEKFISVFVDSGKDKDKDTAIAADHLITSRLFRTLKNRYDLDKNNLTNFKTEYLKVFNDFFKLQPNYAADLLDNEIGKK